MADRFDKFTERARRVLQLAQEEAQRFKHNYIGTEHLLLGLLREGEGVAAKVLNNLGVELDKVRSAVEFIIGQGDRTVAGDIGLTPRARKVIELSVDEARRLNHHYIGTEHLLLGLVREGEGIAAGVLESLGVSLDKVRSQVIYVLNQSAAYSQQEGGATRPISEIEQKVGATRTVTEREEVSEQLDDGARRTVRLAIQGANLRGHSYIGTEHLLLGLIAEREGIGAQALADLAVTREKVDEQLEPLPGEGDRKTAGLGALTTRAKRAIELAVQEAHRRNASVAGTEHLLLGLVAEADGVAVRVLERLGIGPDAVRAAVERRLSGADTP
jgi:ATP-dependent Clp protease ATP-binding subunit ClpA